MEVLACPLCKGPLRPEPEAYFCDPCRRRYPILCGIPDFRILPDRYISIDEDRAKGARLYQDSGRAAFTEMLDRYWAMTPDVPPSLVRKFKAHALEEPRIAEAALNEIGVSSGPLVDVGCSTGGLLVAAAGRFPALFGVDVAFRWLVVGRARLREAGVRAALICANAEFLPFRDAVFGALTANDLIEHVLDPAAVFSECRRVAAPGAACYFSTNNRYSLLAEPHVNVWGVGWLPRPLQAQYVRLAAGLPYRNICLRSAADVRRAASAAGFSTCRLAPAPPSAPRRLLFAQALYNRMCRSPVLSALLIHVGPRLELLCRK